MTEISQFMKNHQTPAKVSGKPAPLPRATLRSPVAISGLLLFVFSISFVGARAQGHTPQNSSTKKKESHWVVGTTYENDQVYLGRKDSVAVPYITPSIGYHDKSGLFITGSVSYLPGAGQNRFDVSTIEAGYSYASDKFNLEVSAAKDFYSDQSFAVTSEIKGRFSASMSYDLGLIEPSLDLGADISDQADIGIGLGVGHSFTMIEDVFEVDPAVHVNGATQNFYDNYYKKRRYSPNRHGGNSKSLVAGAIANASQFQIMDYELEAPFEYTVKKKLKFSFTPTLAIPVNPSTVTTVSKSSGSAATVQSSTESLGTVFYFSLGFSYTF
jgi:hypothetical protein